MLRPRPIRPHLFPNKKATVHYRPYGVIGLITPWNYPLVLVLSPWAQALLAGNAVLLKPSEHATETAALLVKIFSSLALPEPIVQLIEGGPETAQTLAGSAVDKIAFTGGRQGGLAVAAAAAAKLTPLLLELGGNDAMLVAADADIERAAHAAAWGSFFNAGQSCIAVERCYVETAVYDEFLARLAEIVTSLAQGKAELHPELPDHDLGPLLLESTAHRLRELIEDAAKQGAVIRCGGAIDPDSPRMFPPTILSDTTPSMRVMNEEIFGPLLAVMPVATIGEAVELANRSPLGLAASIWTKDIRHAKVLASRLEVGGVVINDCMTHFGIAELPFGGVKQSGYGRTQGREGLMEFCATQTVTHHRFGPRKELQWFPTGFKHRWLARALRWIFRSGIKAKFRSPPPVAPPDEVTPNVE